MDNEFAPPDNNLKKVYLTLLKEYTQVQDV